MADPDKIGIGKISQSETGRGKAQLVYHIPVDTPKAGIVPTPQSSLTGLEQTEIDAFAAGTLVGRNLAGPDSGYGRGTRDEGRPSSICLRPSFYGVRGRCNLKFEI